MIYQLPHIAIYQLFSFFSNWHFAGFIQKFVAVISIIFSVTYFCELIPYMA